ncbi:MAG: LapA family protein [Planctomycetota bacterium]
MQSEKGKVNKLKLFVVLAAIAVIAIVIFQNTEEVETRILFAKIAMPRALLLGIAVAIGFVGGLVAATFRKRK